MRHTAANLAAAATLAATLAAAAQPAPPANGLDTFCRWLAGTFDNFQQVSEDADNKAPTPHARLRTTIAPTVAPDAGGRAFLALSSPAGNPDAVAHALVLSVEAAGPDITTRLFAVTDAQLVARLSHTIPATLPAGSVRELKGCEIVWRQDADAFVGRAVGDGCPAFPAWGSTGVDLRLDATQLRVTLPAAPVPDTRNAGLPGDGPYVLHRARPFTCWAALRKEGSDQYDGWRNVAAHDQGQWIPLPPEAGESAKFAFELSQLRYAQQLPVLKLAIYEAGREQAVAYTWTEPGGKRIGINLRWIQVGCTAR